MTVRQRTQNASHWGVYDVETDGNGRITGVHPFGDDREPSSLIRGLPELVQGPLRIDQPYIREGFLRNPGRPGPHNRGGEAFVPVGWDEALDLAATEINRVRTTYGNEAIYGGSYGWASAGRLHHAPSLLKRFLGLIGGYVDKRGNHSFGAALGIMPHVIGRADITNMVISWRTVVENTDLIVMFGGANMKNMQLDAGGAVLHDNHSGFTRARAGGVRFVNISPLRGDLPQVAEAEWHVIRPGSDLATMLGIAHTLLVEGLADRDFLDRYCTGFERFERYLTGEADGEAKSVDWAAALTGIEAETLRGLARQMVRSRTLVTTSWSIQRAQHGEQPVWMTVVLAAMIGQIGLPGGGFALGFGATNGSLASRAYDIPRPKISLGKNPVPAFCPAGRTNDLLLNPGDAMDYNGTRFTLPDIRLLYSAGGNPFHHNTNTNRLVKAWQRLETVIVNEIFWNGAAKHADIVFPSTSTLERNDILAADQQSQWVAMKQAIEPHAQARNDFDIFAGLAARLGVGEAFTEGRTEMEWLRHMYDEALERALELGYAPPPFDEFWQSGVFDFPRPEHDPVLLEEFVADPDSHPLATPSGLIEIFSERVDGFGYADCPGHPTWLAPSEWLGSDLTSRFPFHLLSNQPVKRLHSQLDPSSGSRETKVRGREPITLNRQDAQRLGIAEGEVVRVFNDRGEMLAGVRLADDLCPGVALISTGAWYDPEQPGEAGALEKHGNPNVLTQDIASSSLAQSMAAQTVLVAIERYQAPLPEITAFDPPPFAAPPG